MSKFDFCIDCHKIIPATENNHVDKGPRCVNCAAKSQTNMEKAFSHIKTAIEAWRTLCQEPGFHSSLWQESFGQMFMHLQDLGGPGNVANAEDTARVAIMWMKAINLAIDELSGVVEDTILVGEWMTVCHRLGWAKDYFEAVMAEIYGWQHLATEEI